MLLLPQFPLLGTTILYYYYYYYCYVILAERMDGMACWEESEWGFVVWRKTQEASPSYREYSQLLTLQTLNTMKLSFPGQFSRNCEDCATL